MPMTDYTSDTDTSGTGSGSAAGSGSIGSGGAGTGIPNPPGPPIPPTPGRPQNPLGGTDIEDLLIDYNAAFSGSAPAQFRDALIDQTMSVLIGHRKPNALLVGPAGVGKTRIVEDIARRLADDDPSVPAMLKGSTIYELQFSAINAGAAINGMLEERVRTIIDFVEDPANKAVLYIDEAHQLFSSKISQHFKPAMARGKFRMIAATTANEARTINDDPALARRFSRLIVDELTLEQTAEVLQQARGDLSTHYRHQVTVSDAVLDDVLHTAEKQMPATMHRPDKQLTLLDRAMGDRLISHHRAVQDAQAAGNQMVVDMLAMLPAYPLTSTQLMSTAQKLRRGTAEVHQGSVEQLEQALRDKLIGQDAVIDRVVDAMARQSLQLFPSAAPVSWMFAGPSGTGKTETVRILAEQMTGRAPIMLNMAEYSHPSDLTKIMGSPPGYIGSDSQREKPFDTLESDSHRVVLLDEFEKAHSDIQRLFLSVLDTGVLTDASGTTIDFSNAIIVATTNAGREEAGERPQIGFSAGTTSAALSDESLTKALSQHFDKELLGRFQLRAAFRPIDRGIFKEICAAHFVRLRAQIAENAPHQVGLLPVDMDDAQLDELAQTSYVTALGARPAQAAVRRWIEDRLLNPAPAVSASGAQPAVLPSMQDPDQQDSHHQV